MQTSLAAHPPVRVGIIAMQGDYDAHYKAVEAAGGSPFLIREAASVADADALILPGGESTTIGKLLVRYGLDDAIREANSQQKPVYGTCAGMILMATHISAGEKRGGQPTLGLMDIGVARNAFGRQVDSFEADIESAEVARGTNEPSHRHMRGVFIRAPYVVESGPDVEVIARYQDRAVMVRQGHLLASAFHPELTSDTIVHRYFLAMARARKIVAR